MVVLCERLAKSVTIFIPFLDTATMERVDEEEGRVASANPDMILGMFVKGVEVIVVDPHTLQQRFYLKNGVVMTPITAVPVFKKELMKYRKANPNEKVVIAFPDNGAFKRFGKKFKEYETIVCGKVRTNTGDRVVTVTDGDPKGKQVVIVDDLVQSGGTLFRCREALLKSGAVKVSTFVTHVVFPGNVWKKFVGGPYKGFSNFWYTDTCYKKALLINGKGPFKMLSVNQMVCDSLLLP